ncbi:MAG: DUF1573 domain-containing protein [Bacteroidales bacterium]|nr:DUF1573 domain-containing protein [Bacteroidales bacterium]MBN2757566.1 DUF1573 domain-containing protein [Bacteroidales bacterium]
MKTLIFILSLSLLFGANNSLFAQNSISDIKFEKETHDFGRIKEDGGTVNYKFKFKNIGKSPVVITRVQSSCGCTTPEWTRSPIVPGEEGFVSAEFDPNERPGAFNKHVLVYTNVLAEPIKLVIKGDVINKEKSIADIYRYKIGDLRTKANYITFARMYNSEKKSMSVEIINDSEKSIDVGFVADRIPNHLSVEVKPSTLKPKQKGEIIITFDASKKNDWGNTTDRLRLTVNNEQPVGNNLSVSASILEDFSALSKSELANAPTMVFDHQEFDFGKIKHGDVITHEFKFKNTGKRDLFIRKTQSSCGCTAVETQKVIKPGETSVIKATFNSRGKKGRQNKSITIITNIPGKDEKGVDKYKVILRIKGEVIVE